MKHVKKVYEKTLLVVVLWVSSLLCLDRSARSDDLFPNWPTPAEISVTLGKQEILIPAGTGGLNHFPDEPISILSQRPLTFLMVCGGDTYLWSGQTLKSSLPVAKALSPGPTGSPDSHYAGIASVYQDKQKRRWVAFYHAENQEDMPKIDSNGIQGYYGTICVAESSLDKLAFRKLGPCLTADQPKKPRGWETEGGSVIAWAAQGVGTPSVCNDSEDKYLLCVYSDRGNYLKRGAQLYVARAPIESAGQPGSWNKYHSGAFSQPGLGGQNTAMINGVPKTDLVDPHVQYVKAWKRYILIFGTLAYADFKANPFKPTDSGIFVSTSTDAVQWTKPTKIIAGWDGVFSGQEGRVHPKLSISKVDRKTLTGQLQYGYTPLWPDTPHHLAGCSIRIVLQDVPK